MNFVKTYHTNRKIKMFVGMQLQFSSKFLFFMSKIPIVARRRRGWTSSIWFRITPHLGNSPVLRVTSSTWLSITLHFGNSPVLWIITLHLGNSPVLRIRLSLCCRCVLVVAPRRTPTICFWIVPSPQQNFSGPTEPRAWSGAGCSGRELARTVPVLRRPVNRQPGFRVINS